MSLACSAKMAPWISLMVWSMSSTARVTRSATSGRLIIGMVPCSDMPVAYSQLDDQVVQVAGDPVPVLVPAELLLCGHHYRVSRQALAAANATVTELSGPEGSRRDALLLDLPSPRAQVS